MLQFAGGRYKWFRQVLGPAATQAIIDWKKMVLIINSKNVDTVNDKEIFLDGQAFSGMERVKLLRFQIGENLNFASRISE